MKPPVLKRAYTVPILPASSSKGLPLHGLRRQKSVQETKKLYNDTQPISFDGMFDGGFKDDYYHRTYMEELQRTEKEVFYGEEVKEMEEAKSLDRFDQKKLDKILVGVFEVWDDKKYDDLIPKIELLVAAKANISTMEGAGIFRNTLLARTFYTKHKKLRLALLELADLQDLEPKTEASIFTVACNAYDHETLTILLNRKAEPNRIAKNGLTPITTLCQHYTHRKEDINHVEQLKCIELLINYEGPDANTLKNKWAKKFNDICPNTIESAWRCVADFCIPNINVRPIWLGEKDCRMCLQGYKNPQSFVQKAMALLRYLFTDARFQREPYWPKERAKYIKMFNPVWGK